MKDLFRQKQARLFRQKQTCLSIVIVNFNTKELLKNCVQSIKKHTKGVIHEIIVVDNGSTDGSAEFLENESSVKTIFNKDNVGFAKANNQGIKRATGRYVLLLNSDTELKGNSLGAMVNWMDKHPKVGIATCKLLNPDGTVQATGGYFPSLLRIFLWATFLDDLPPIASIFGSYHPHTSKFGGSFYNSEHPQDWVTGAFFFFRRELIEKVGYLDEEFFMYVEEVDYCMRVKKQGWDIWYAPQTAIIHFGGGSEDSQAVTSGEGLIREGAVLGEFKGLKKFYRKHYPLLQYPLLILLLKLAAILRILVFGILGRQGLAWRTYGKALAIG